MIKKYIFIALVLITGCSTVTSPPNNTGTNSNNSDKVSFNIKIDKTVFAANSELTARIYDSEQLQLANNTSGCTVSYDVATGKETYSCPPEVTYKPSTPEVFTFKLSEINNDLNIKTNSVTVGENYRIQISGKASDNCNTASASREAKANSATENINNLEWATTQLGCLP